MGSELTRFRDVLEYAIGGGWGKETPDAKHAVAVTVVRGTDFSKLRGGDLNEVPRRYEVGSKVTKRTLEVGDIILEVSGGSPARGQTTGRTCYIDDVVLETLHQPIIPASFCRLVRVDRSKVVPRFAYYWLQDMYQSGRAAAYENQSTGISNFQFERFLDAEAIVLPDLSIQQHVVETLVSIDDRIDNLRQTNATLEAIAQALFKSWFVDFDPVRAKAEGREPEGMDAATAALFPGEFEDSELGPIPKGWQVRSLDSIAQYLNGLALQKFPPESESEYLPVIKIAQLRAGNTNSSDKASAHLKPEYIVEDGDVLFSWSGSLEVEIWCGGRGALNQHLFKVTSKEVPKWFYYFATRQHLPDFREIAAHKATTMGHIQRRHLTEAKVVLPSSDLIAKLSEVFEPAFERRIASSLQANALSSVRDTLLPRLISGRVRLPAAEALNDELLA